MLDLAEIEALSPAPPDFPRYAALAAAIEPLLVPGRGISTADLARKLAPSAFDTRSPNWPKRRQLFRWLAVVARQYPHLVLGTVEAPGFGRQRGKSVTRVLWGRQNVERTPTP